MVSCSWFFMFLATPFPSPSSVFRIGRRPVIPVAALSASPTSSYSISRRRRLLRPSCSRIRHGLFLRSSAEVHTQAAAANGDTVTSAPHLWPEWLRLIEHLASGGYSNKRLELSSDAVNPDDDSFVDGENLAEEFLETAEACLRFARDRPDLLRLLPRKDIEVLVENTSPFLFRNGANSTMRLKSYLRDNGTNVGESERAGTLDIMRYLLSNICKIGVTHYDFLGAGELVETSTRNLLSDLVKIHKSRPVDPDTRQTSLKTDSSLKPQGQTTEMKRGDWICPKCAFMNFARNMKCLECNEARPKRVLTGGEWECPQCDFFNYGRNMSCLRCDCRRPPDSASVNQILKETSISRSEIESKLAANDEKAERWFSKMSQLGNSDDPSSAIADKDFPEIMPMRKGVNRFVVSTRKTSLERRLENAQINSNSGNSGPSMGNESQVSNFSAIGSDKSAQSSISQSLDRILGHSPAASGAYSQTTSGKINDGSKFTSDKQRSSSQIPFVPLSADMFSKSQNANNEQYPRKDESVLKEPEGASEKYDDEDSSHPAERWLAKSSELDTTSATSDEVFPEIMPMRKGENRFVISKKKDRSLTSPQYKKRMAMEQANTSNFVPFVPFPPDYFAKKNSKPEASSSLESTSEGSASQEKSRKESMDGTSNLNVDGSTISRSEIKHTNQSSTPNYTSKGFNGKKVESTDVTASAKSGRFPSNTSDSESGTRKNNYVQKSEYFGASGTASSRQQEISESSEEGWKPSFSGKSLEGSAVSKEPDPLDMSEEAKAARWFRRVAQIKDISELSNIPDEDFPEIMPMRKGVNRFVVSKRKTPLERRLTSAQYRRNLPIISSEPEKDNQQDSG